MMMLPVQPNRLTRLPSRAFLALLLSLLLPFVTSAEESDVVAYLWQGASLTQMLTPELADSLGIKAIAPEFEVVDGRNVLLLSTSGDLLDLGSGRALPAREPLRVSSFTVSAGLIVAVRNGHVLGWYGNDEINQRLTLPAKGMKVASGKGESFFLYGPDGEGSAIYQLEAGEATFLLRVPEGEITAFTSIGDRIFFAVDGTIYTHAAREPAGLVFLAAEEEPIRSIAADPIAGVLYYSAGDAVYVMRAGVAMTVMRGVSGILRYSGDALFVLDPGRRRLLKVQGLEKLILGEAQSTESIRPDDFME